LVSRQHHYYGGNHLHFVTASTYRRARLFDFHLFKEIFIQTLDQLGTLLEFRLLGYVLMPEHFHLLIWPQEKANPSRIVASLKQRTARTILQVLKQEAQSNWFQSMLEAVRLPASVHDEATFRVWQRRFYDFNVWSDKKRLEKLDYMHDNPVHRRLVDSPADWPWSSWRHYNLGDSSVLSIDRYP
jgi:REP-associated tyrosine transposase